MSFSIEFEKGAQEDLDPSELEPVDEFQDSSESSQANEKPSPEDDTDTDEATDIDEARSNQLQKVLPTENSWDALSASHVQFVDDEVSIVVEDVSPPCRAGLIAAGALAIGLKERQVNRDATLVEEFNKLNNAGNKFSFRKSARISRRVGD